MMPENSAKFNYYSAPWLQTRRFWVALILLTLLVGSAWIVYSRTWVAQTLPSNPANLEPAPIKGHPAPDFALQTLAGKTIRLSDYKGKPVLINFWATWCGPCRAEFPDFQKAWTDNADRLVIIGINNTTTDDKSQIPAFLDEYGITFPIVLDESGDTAKVYNILGLPTSIFIDRNGIVNELFTGPLNKAYIEAKLGEL